MNSINVYKPSKSDHPIPLVVTSAAMFRTNPHVDSSSVKLCKRLVPNKEHKKQHMVTDLDDPSSNADMFCSRTVGWCLRARTILPPECRFCNRESATTATPPIRPERGSLPCGPGSQTGGQSLTPTQLGIPQWHARTPAFHNANLGPKLGAHLCTGT